MTIHRSADVYGIGRELPLNYVERDKVDHVLLENLTRDKHVVVFGSSKQGKTSLRKYALSDDDCVTVSCLNTMSLPSLHGMILKSIGYRVEQSHSRTESGSLKVIAELGAEGKLPFVAKVSGKGGAEALHENQIETNQKRLELDLSDVNDIILALNEAGFDKFIVLEDFHYLPIETQRNFAFALKSFHENSRFCFIKIGVWREENRLVYYNGDLTGRVISIDADGWSRQELEQVISAGESLLNIKFTPDFTQEVLQNSFDAVYLVQEACLRACELSRVFETQSSLAEIGSGLDAKGLVKAVVDSQAGRYAAFINNFSEGFQKTDLEMYKWLMFAVIASDQDDLERGLRRSEISAKIKEAHPEGGTLNEGNVTQALQNASSLQVQKNVRPIVIDYDQTTRVLHVVDRSFLIWLAHQDRGELLSELGIAI
jgi:hypothetical protein